MKKILSTFAVLMMLMCMLITQVSGATTIGYQSYEIVSENGINVATTTIDATWKFTASVGEISADASYSDKTQYKFIYNLANDVSGNAGAALPFIGDFEIKSNGFSLISTNPWNLSVWNIKDGGVLVLDNIILIDDQADTNNPTGSGVIVENGGVLYLKNGAKVSGFNYNIEEKTHFSTGTSASLKILNGGTLNIDSSAKQEPIYCEAGATINLSSTSDNIQWKINGESFTGTTYTATSAGYVTVDFEIQCTNHDYQLSAQKANNCKNDGTKTYICSICLNEKVETVLADPNAHVWADGICSVCFTECEHSWSEWTLTGPSGYAENQWKDYAGHIQKHCFVCNKQMDVEIPELQLGLLAGKNILMSGDSVISGYSDSVITNFTGATVTKIGVSSATVSTGEGDNRLISQLIKNRQNNPNAEYDIVFLFGGINDARCETPIGQLSADGNYDIDTFIGALEELIEYAKKEYPNSEIAYLIPYKTTYAEATYGGLIDHRDDYTNAIIAVCEKWGVPYLDMYNSDMISGVLNGTREITTTDISVGYNNLAQYDGLHLNYSGYYYMSVFVSQMAEKLILGEYQYEVIAEKNDATCAENGNVLKYNFETGALELQVIAATGVHTYTDDFNCETALNCEVCKKTLIESLSHTIIVTISYANGYDNAGTKTTYCSNEGCSHNVTNESKALFICLGYSAPEFGEGGIAVGFTVNNEAITEYQTVTGKAVKYGVFAVLQNKLGGNEIFGEDGATSEGVISADITNYEFAAFELKIVGFTDEQKGTKFAMGAYVCVAGKEATEYSYMQDDAEGEKVGNYYFVSYNDVIGTVSSEEAAQ